MSDSQLKPLDDEQVEGVAGGYVYYSAESSFSDQWQVIDDKGAVICSHAFWEDAERCARDRGFSDREITWEELQRLRETGSIQ